MSKELILLFVESCSFIDVYIYCAANKKAFNNKKAFHAFLSSRVQTRKTMTLPHSEYTLRMLVYVG